VLEHSRVPRHEGRCGEPEHLPEWKIPGHDRQDDTQGIIGHERLRTADVDLSSCEKVLCIFSKIVTVKGTLLDFVASFLEGLTHFRRHQLGKYVLPAPEHARRRLHQARAMGKRGAAPLLPSMARLACDDEGFVPRVAFVGWARLFIGRIGGRKPRLRARRICWLAGVGLVLFGKAIFFAHGLGGAL
jgi:hypothetical protein